MPEVFLGLGSNVDPSLHLPTALAELAAEFGALSLSSLYEAAAVGFQGPSFQNLVVAFSTDRSAEDVLDVLAVIETRHGRRKGDKQSVPLDIDLLLYGDAIVERGRLRLPRPGLRQQAFVLEPLAEIAPTYRHPQTGETYGALWAGFDRTGLVQRRLGPPSVAGDALLPPSAGPG